MPPATTTGSAYKRINSSPQIPQLASPSGTRAQVRAAEARSREKRDTGTLTPIQSKGDAINLENERFKAGSGRSEQRPVAVDSTRFRPCIDDSEQDDPLKICKRWSREKRREGKGSLHSLDGPVLRPKPEKLPHLSASRTFEDHDVPFSYAQVASTSNSFQPRNSIQLSPAISRLRSSRSSISDPSPSNSLYQQPPEGLAPGEQNFDAISSAAPSVFDEQYDGEEKQLVSDFETDASSLSNSENQGLPFDVDRDERLTRPDEYFRELEDLEASIAGNSGLFLMSSQNRRAYPKTNTFRLRFAFECYSMGPDSRNSEFTSFDQHIMAYCNDRTRVNGELDHGLADLAFHVLECRNLMLSVVSNIERMKQQKYCQGFMSMLTLDNKRSNVVNLVKLPTKEIRMLHRGFEDAIGQALSLMESSRLEKSLKVRGVRERISAKVQQMLQHCGLPLGFSDFGDWRRLVMVLDLAVISYAGTHQEDFAGRFLGESLDLAKITPAWTYDPLASKNIMLRRRRLRCLDKLLQSPVWVFQDSSKWADRGALYLSTDLEAFADVWGPVWSVKPNDDAASIILYRVGFGLLCRWPPEFSVGRLRTDEVFCHWISSEEPPSKQKHFEHFPEGARLLIGAGTLIENTTSQLKETLDCSTRTSKVIRELRSTHRLEELGTSPDEKYLAEECVTAQLGYSGVTLGGQRTYKRRTGVTLKQAICDEWKNSNSSSRNPAILERWIGLEVSFCSGNARRRRLKHILGSTTMMNWLDSCKTNDTAFPCEDAFRDAIQSRDCRAFRTLWSQRREWRKDLGQLVSWCLEGLAHSKLDAAGDLHVLWMPKPEKRMIVRIRQNRHAWTGFLTDSRDHCAMAVMSGKCLSSDYKYASYCQSKAQLSYSILETALVINEMAPQPKSLELRPCEGDKKKQPHYVIAHLAPGEKLQVHSSGRLRVRETFARTRLLCEWERGVSRKMFEATQQLGRTVGIEQHHHWELKDDDDSPVKSIPLFVISQCRDGR